MKRIFTLVLAFSVSLAATAQSQYLGNRGTGFGGAIGQSSLTISEDATRVYFNLVKGTGNFNDAFVIYIDALANGYTTTSGFTDAGDPSRTAISGLSYESSPGNGIRKRSVLDFPNNFAADYAIVVNPSNNSYAYLFTLVNGGGHLFVEQNSLSPDNNTNNTSYSFSFIKTNISSASPFTFKFIGTYLNSGYDVFRSNEGYGIASAIVNPGYNTITAASFFTYPNPILPVQLLSFTGSVVDSKGKLSWQVANDREISKYEIEKSSDGRNFSALQSVAARHTTAVQSYTVEDANLTGTNYYRLKTTDLQGVVTYSKIVQLSIGVKGQGFTIFPNPVMQTLNIKMAKLEKGRYDVNVYSASGQLVFAKAIQYDGSGNTLQIELPANIQRGNYNCILNSANGKFTSSFLKQ